jgi:hypothetical protein
MKNTTLALMLVAACGSDELGNDPGGGTGTLLVNASIDQEDGAAELVVTVDRAGQDVDDAIVRVTSELGEVTLALSGGGEYRGVQAGWAAGYEISVTSGEDSLTGSIDAPGPIVMTSPLSGFDAQAAEGGLVRISWDGERSMEARVRTDDFDQTVPDDGALDVAATFFVQDQQEIEIRRRNTVTLAGGAPGSRLEATFELTTDVTVTNPFPG